MPQSNTNKPSETSLVSVEWELNKLSSSVVSLGSNRMTQLEPELQGLVYTPSG